jgi:hypothetical protein
MSRHWYEETCPACGVANWIDNGDETDLTLLDVDEYTCHACKKVIRLTRGEYGDVYEPHVMEEDYSVGSHVDGELLPRHGQ